MKTIVITGSTRGLGYGLAEACLARGCNVVISGRTADAVEAAVEKLAQQYPSENIFGQPCDTGSFKQVQNLWDSAKMHFGEVDIWVNNAGIGHGITPFLEVDPELINSIIQTNVTGYIYGGRVAAAGMRAQGHGAIYFMEGKGSRGKVQAGMSIYSTSKRAVNYLVDALIKELEEFGIIVGSISPGMVITDLLLVQRERSEEEWQRTRRIFNILADTVENVSPWIADQIINNQQHGAKFHRLSTPKILWRFLTAPITKREII